MTVNITKIFLKGWILLDIMGDFGSLTCGGGGTHAFWKLLGSFLRISLLLQS